MEECAIEKAVREAERFLARVKEYQEAKEAAPHEWKQHPKQTGAVRRASLDLTRALADMRQNRKGGA